MAEIRPEIREELLRFWARRGIALCAEAQADGVPCIELDRPCETCAKALQALEEIQRAEVGAMPECGP